MSAVVDAANNMLQSDGVIAGVHTQCCVGVHDDRIVVILTQLKKIGTVLDIRRDTAVHPQSMIQAMDSGGPQKAWRIRTLLGRRDDVLLQLLARQLAEKVGAYSPLPILLCVALAGGAARRGGGAGGAGGAARRHDLFQSTGRRTLEGCIGLVARALSSKAPPER